MRFESRTSRRTLASCSCSIGFTFSREISCVLTCRKKEEKYSRVVTTEKSYWHRHLGLCGTSLSDQRCCYPRSPAGRVSLLLFSSSRCFLSSPHSLTHKAKASQQPPARVPQLNPSPFWVEEKKADSITQNLLCASSPRVWARSTWL